MKALWCLIAPALLPAPAAAQQEAPVTEDREPIVVTGAGLDSAPGSETTRVEIIDRERLTATASGRIEDALRDVAGFAQFRRADSRSAHPTSQGAGLRGLGGNAASRALVLLDGVPQADPFGAWIPFPAYQAERLSAARVTRGGGSGFYGPGALAGTIELESIRPGEIGTLSASLFGGSRASAEANAVGLVPAGTGFMLLSGQYARGDGFVPIAEGAGAVDRAAPYEQANAAARFVADWAGTELQANLSGFVDRRDRGFDYSGIRSEGADASIRLVGRGAWQWSALAYLQARAFGSGFARVDDDRGSASPVLDQYIPSTGSGARIELAPPVGEAVTLRIGADLRRVSGRTQELYSYVDNAPTRRRVAGGSATTFGAFGDLAVESGRWTFSAGGRLDRWRIDPGALDERMLTGEIVTDTVFPARDGWEATGRAGIAFAATPALDLTAAAYRGWRLPTLNELYRPYRVGADAIAANAALAPERLTGVDLGLEWRPAPDLRVAVTGFVNHLADAVANVTLARGPGEFPGVGFVSAAGSYAQRRNLDAVDSRGVEVDLGWRHRAWSVDLSWAHIDARVSASGNAAFLDRLRPAQTAANHVSATLGWEGQAMRTAVTLRHVGPQWEDDLNSLRLASATTIDAVVAVPVSDAVSIVARGENLADTRIETARDADGVVERAGPRTFWLGARLSL